MQVERLMELVNRKPFQPFTINLNDGEAIDVDSIESILFPNRHPELIIVFSENGVIHYFEYQTVSSVDTL